MLARYRCKCADGRRAIVTHTYLLMGEMERCDFWIHSLCLNVVGVWVSRNFIGAAACSVASDQINLWAVKPFKAHNDKLSGICLSICSSNKQLRLRTCCINRVTLRHTSAFPHQSLSAFHKSYEKLYRTRERRWIFMFIKYINMKCSWWLAACCRK